MSPALLIARSEYLRRVRTRWFVIGTVAAPLMVLLFPALIGLFVTASVPEIMADPEPYEGATATAGAAPERLAPLALGVVGPRADRVAAAAPDTVRAVVLARADTALAQLAADRLDAVAVLASVADTVVLSKVVVGVYQSRWQEASDVASGAVGRAQGAAPAAASGARADADAASLGPPVVPGLSPHERESLDDLLAIFRTLAAVLLGGAVSVLPTLYGGAVLRGVIEEKTDRVVEILVSSVRPFELLMGKVLGIGAVGLTQLAIWGALAGLALAGASAAVRSVASEALAESPVGAAEAQVVLGGIAGAVTAPLVAVLLLLFVSSYLLISSLYAAVGSAVDKEADAQQLMAPVGLLTTLPFFALPLVAADPDGPLSVALSLVPPVSPAAMATRLVAGSVPFWQVALSLSLLAASFAAAIWLAARVYRVGILMTGTTPSLTDLWRWARTP